MKQEKVAVLALVIASIAVISGCVEQTPSGPTVSGEASYALLWSHQVNDQVWGVSISPDGSYVAVRSGFDVHFYNTEGRLLWSRSEHEIDPSYRYHFGPLSVSADGSYVAAGASLFDREGKFLWGVESRRDLPVGIPSLSADGSYLAVGWSGSTTSEGAPGTVGRYVYLYDRNGSLLWNYTTGWSAEWGGVRDVSISSDGNYVVAGSGDAYIYFFNRGGKLLWSYRTGDKLCFEGTRDNISSKKSQGAIGAVSVSSDGSYVAVGAYDGNIYLFTREGRLLWNYSRDVVGDAFNASIISKIPGAYLTGRCTDSINRILISSDGSYVVAMDGGGYVYLLDRDGKLLWRGAEKCVGTGPLSRCGGVANSISISSDASYIAVGGRDGKVHVYKRKGDLIFSSEEEKQAVNPFMGDSVSISSDGSYVAAGTSISSGGSYAGKIYFFGKGAAQVSVTAGAGTNISANISEPAYGQAVSEPGWVTHTYEEKQMGYAFSFDTPVDWKASGPVGARGVGGWYDPAYPKPPSPEAVWCYWITVGMPGGEMPPLGDPIATTSDQKTVSTVKVGGDWAYHLMCVSSLENYGRNAEIFGRIFESLKPLS